MTKQQQIAVFNARKNNNVFTIKNQQGKVVYYIDTTNNRAIVNNEMMELSAARKHFAETKVGATAYRGEGYNLAAI